MIRRQVTCTTKSANGEVTGIGGSLFNETEEDAIAQIECKSHYYYTYFNGQTAEVEVITINGNKHLRSSPDGTTRNNLAELRDC